MRELWKWISSPSIGKENKNHASSRMFVDNFVNNVSRDMLSLDNLKICQFFQRTIFWQNNIVNQYYTNSITENIILMNRKQVKKVLPWWRIRRVPLPWTPFPQAFWTTTYTRNTPTLFICDKHPNSQPHH